MKVTPKLTFLLSFLYFFSMGTAYYYGRRVERVAWQNAVYGIDKNPHKVLMARVLSKLEGK